MRSQPFNSPTYRRAHVILQTILLGLLSLYANVLVAQIGGPNGSGQWSPVYNMPIVPVAMANLPDGKVVCWASQKRDGFGGGQGQTYTSVYNPDNNSFTDVLVSNTNHDMFCPGINNMADGRLLVAGGDTEEATSIYDWQTQNWSTGPDMVIPRGYQSNATLADGSLFTIGGSWSGGRGNKDGEIYTASGGWRRLVNVTAAQTVEEGTQGYSGEGVYRRDNHAWIWQAPNGRVFHAGPGEQMHWIDVAGNGNVDDAGTRGTDQYAMNGNAVMYDIGKILTLGGAPSYASGNTSSGDAYVIDINGNNPVVTRTGDLNFNRTMQNAVVLPTGEVFVVGGLRDAEIFTDVNSRVIAEMWNPTTGTFRNLAPIAIPRNYHSAAILLYDGRILAGGGGLCNNGCPNHSDAEVYSPPYLFNTNGSPATRPIINSAPAQADHNGSISVGANTSIDEWVLIRLSNATHSVNVEQRRIPLVASPAGGNNYSLSIPGATVAIPGYYMLFAMKNGVPSVSVPVQVGNGQTGGGNNNTQARFSLQNGNIPGMIQGEYYDTGGQGVAYNDDGTKNGDTSFRPGDNVDCNILSGSNYKVGWTASGEWLEYTVNAQAGTYDVIVTATSNSTSPNVGSLQVSLDGVNLGAVQIGGTGGWTSPQDFTLSGVNISGGTDKVLRLTFNIAGGTNFDFDKITFVSQQTCPDGDNDGVCDDSDQCPGFDDNLIGTACDDGDVCTLNDVYLNDCSCAGTYSDSDNDGVCDALDDCVNDLRTVFDQNFSNTSGAFTVASGAFSSPNPNYESASAGSTAYSLSVGGVDNSTQTNMSLGLQRNFSLPESGEVTIAINYTLNVAAGYDAGEWTEVRVSVDGNLLNDSGNPYLSRLEAGSPSTTGAQTATLNLNSLPVGNHTLVVGLFNNLKTYNSESSQLLVDRITLTQACSSCDPASTGTACDDGDACTTNDVLDANCNCAGTIADSDNDGICDVDDQCPGFDDSLIGTACNDGDDCTLNDVYTSDCGCAGTPAPDSDNDGLCDAIDSCPNLANNLIGTACDDGDACTTNDVYTSNCDCAGTPVTDSDNDGICDANDQCPGFDDGLIGTTCNDGDDCTVNDVYTSDCACAGTPAPDSDNDGLCDAIDSCPNLANSLIGTACNDGDACTVNDVYTSNCGCIGTVADSDNDGVCDANDQCPGFDNGLIGTACDDGDPNTINDVYTASCTCAGEVPGGTDFWLEAECGEVGSAWTLINNGNASEGEALTFTGTSSTGSAPTAASARVRFTIDITEAGSYEIFARSIAPNGGDDSYWVRANNGNWVRFNKVNGLNQNNNWQWDQVGEWTTGAPDNNPVSFNLGVGTTTIDFAYRENGIQFDKVFVTLDQGVPSGLGATATNCVPDCTPGTACNDGDPCTINDTFDSNCDCSGTFQDADNDGVCNANDVCPNFDDTLIGTACNDGDPCTANDVYTTNCDCAGTPTGDSDNDGICDAQDSCPNLANNLIGTACNDGDACTVNDVYTSDCGCVGTVADSDNDGVCDADDQCPGFDNNLIGTPCDDGDPNTNNDVYTSACNCEGTTDGLSGTITLDPIHAAYLQGSTLFNNAELRVENGNRVTYLQFDLSSVPNTVTSAELILTVGSDSGSGLITVDKGSSNNWTETNLSNSNKPTAIQQLGSLNSGYSSNSSYTWSLTPGAFTGSTISLIVEHNSGNDVSFKSDENNDVAGRPQLVLTYGNALQGLGTPGVPEATSAIKNGLIIAYPNPFGDELTVELPSDKYHTLLVVNLSGQLITKQEIPASTTKLELNTGEWNTPSGEVLFLRFIGTNDTELLQVIRQE